MEGVLERVLRRIFGPTEEEVAGGWGRLHSEGLHNLCTAPHAVRVITSSSMRWAGHAARWYTRNANKI